MINNYSDVGSRRVQTMEKLRELPHARDEQIYKMILTNMFSVIVSIKTTSIISSFAKLMAEIKR